MSFANLSPLWVVVGLGALAGLLVLLQRLRVRHRLVEVETMLFWRQAIDESRARVLVERFRYPWIYALLLLIVSALWLAFAGVHSDGSGRRDHLVLIDGSAAMASGDRFAVAKRLAIEYASAQAEGSCRVVLCGGRARTLLRAGESALLLSHRLTGASAEACPNTVSKVLHDLVRGDGERPMSVCIVGDAWLTEAERERLGSTVELRRIGVGERAANNRGITALGVRAALDAAWDRVDVLVDVVGTDAVPQLALNGAVQALTGERVPRPDGTVRHRFRVAAHGERLVVALPSEDALVLDDRAMFVLPDRRAIAVAIEPGVPDIVRRVVRADPGLIEQHDDARVTIRVAGSSFGGELPAIELSDAALSDDAFLVFHDEAQDPRVVLDELYVDLGLQEIDAMATAEAMGRTITMGAKPAVRRSLWLWRSLLDERYDFVGSRAFPLFVGVGIRWLVGFDEGPVRVAVGEPVASGDVAVLHDGVTTRAFGAEFVPMSAGVFEPASGRAFAASLLDPLSSGTAPDGVAQLTAASTSGVGVDWITLLLLLALLLLVIEWGLFRASRIP